MSRRDESSCLGLFRFSSLRVLALLLAAALLTSCGRRSGPIAQEQTNLSWLGSMYQMFVSQNQGHAPKNIDQLRKFVEKSTGSEQLARLKVATVGEIFVSPRDGRPFAMVSYDKFSAPAAGQPPPVVLYEAEGQNGRRAVAFLGGGTQSVDEQALQKMLPSQTRLTR
jgi:hypothetical protein